MTPADIETLRMALASFAENEHGCHIRSPLFELQNNIRLKGDVRLHAAAQAASQIHQDVWNTAILVSRLEWMRQAAVDGKLDSILWMSYCKVDLEAFLVQLRSIMDYSVAIIDVFAPNKGRLPSTFRPLRERIDRIGAQLPAGVEPLVRGAAWFDEIRAVRDSLVHGGAESLVFHAPEEGILFQIYGADFRKKMVSKPSLMFNENVVRFELFAAWLFGSVLTYLNSLGGLFVHQCQPPPGVGASRSYCPGYETLRGWIVLALDECNDQRDFVS